MGAVGARLACENKTKVSTCKSAKMTCLADSVKSASVEASLLVPIKMIQMGYNVPIRFHTYTPRPHNDKNLSCGGVGVCVFWLCGGWVGCVGVWVGCVGGCVCIMYLTNTSLNAITMGE